MESNAASMAQELREAMLAVMHAQRRHFEARAQARGLNAQQAIALFKLGATESLQMRELAGQLGCDPSSLTGIADRLEDAGLVERRPDPADRRATRLRITPSGERLRAEVIAEVDVAGAPGFSVLSIDEQRQLLEYLQRVLDAAPD